MIEMNMEEKYFSIGGLEIFEIVLIKRVSTKIDNEVGLFVWWYLSHMFIVCHNPHLKDISRAKLVTKYMPRNCFSDIVEDILNLLWGTRKF